MDNIMTAEAVPSRQFNIFTGILKASGSAEEGMQLSGVASSTVKDLHGDTMQESAIRDMETAARKGLTIFLNHEYRVPEDVAGSTTGAIAVQRGMDADGAPIWDLDLDIDINDANQRAVETWTAIRKKGTKLGISIGANIPKDGYEVNDEGRYDIAHVELLEASIVGIPANPRSWVSKAVDALPVLPDDIIEEVKAEEVEAAPPADDREETITDDTQPEAADEPVIEAEPEADTSEPDDAALESETALVSAAIESLDKVEGEVNLTQLQMAVDIARSAVEANAALKIELDKALRAKEESDREKDEAIEGTGKILAGVRSLIQEIKDTPLGRKTTALEPKERKLKHLEGQYGAEFMKLLEK
jgi:phage head maturation protease